MAGIRPGPVIAVMCTVMIPAMMGGRHGPWRRHRDGEALGGALAIMMRTTPDALVLVTSADCHLCEHAWQVLDALDRPVCEVDVASAEAGELAARGVALAFPPS